MEQDEEGGPGPHEGEANGSTKGMKSLRFDATASSGAQESDGGPLSRMLRPRPDPMEALQVWAGGRGRRGLDYAHPYFSPHSPRSYVLPSASNPSLLRPPDLAPSPAWTTPGGNSCGTMYCRASTRYAAKWACHPCRARPKRPLLQQRQRGKRLRFGRRG